MVEALEPGDPTEIAGYVLRGKLGEGGMGSVYLSHSRGGQPIALKVVRREFARNPEFLRRFAREVEAARRVQGAYTAAVLDSSTEGPQPWLATAYVPGPSLGHTVYTHGALPLRTVLLLVAGVAEALQSVHAAEVVHRDLKPSNVLLAADGPRVIDFGIARASDVTVLTGADVRLGTPSYMAPEQIQGSAVGPAADVFALGLVMYFAATAGHPFGEGDGAALQYRIMAQEPDLTACPEQLRPLVARCLAKDPDGRPDLSEIIDECHRVAAAEGMTLARDEGWWLPSSVVDEATRRLVPSRAPSPPPAVPESAPGAGQGPGYGPAYLPTVTDARRSGDGRPDQPPPSQESSSVKRMTTMLLGGPRRRAKTTGAVVALAVIAAGTFAAVRGLTGDDDKPTASPGWLLTQTDVPMTIPAPLFDKDSDYNTYSGHECAKKFNEPFNASVYIDLNTLQVHKNHDDTTDSELAKDSQSAGWALQYSDCSDGTGTSGAGPRSGFRLVSGFGSWGVVTRHGISAAECKRAATNKKLASPITVQQIQARKVLHSGMGLCVLTKTRILTLLWITKDTLKPDNDNLREFTVQATQWRPE